MENRLNLYNTLTKKVETFVPRVDGKVSMYTCRQYDRNQFERHGTQIHEVLDSIKNQDDTHHDPESLNEIYRPYQDDNAEGCDDGGHHGQSPEPDAKFILITQGRYEDHDAEQNQEYACDSYLVTSFRSSTVTPLGLLMSMLATSA